MRQVTKMYGLRDAAMSPPGRASRYWKTNGLLLLDPEMVQIADVLQQSQTDAGLEDFVLLLKERIAPFVGEVRFVLLHSCGYFFGSAKIEQLLGFRLEEVFVLARFDRLNGIRVCATKRFDQLGLFFHSFFEHADG